MSTTRKESSSQAGAGLTSPRRRKLESMGRFENLGDLVQRDRDLDKIAIIDLSGETPREFSYAKIDAMARSLARALIAGGLKRGERVAILSANRAEYLGAVFGIMRAGLVAVPVNYKFPRSTIA